jgi:hypothetical protein
MNTKSITLNQMVKDYGLGLSDSIKQQDNPDSVSTGFYINGTSICDDSLYFNTNMNTGASITSIYEMSNTDIRFQNGANVSFDASTTTTFNGMTFLNSSVFLNNGIELNEELNQLRTMVNSYEHRIQLLESCMHESEAPVTTFALYY